MNANIRSIEKRGVRILAVASGPIEGRKRTIAVGVVKNGVAIEGILSCMVEVDGNDSAKNIIGMVESSKFRSLIKVIVFDGAALAGLNIVNVNELRDRLDVHVMLITRHKPRSKALRRAIVRFGKNGGKGVEGKLAAYKSLEALVGFEGKAFYAMSDIKGKIAQEIADYAFEALRLAHMIARGVATGESRGRI
ncbi:MAG: DUF99 family protein [Candidatus Micrarchaeaceae archaeon]